MRGHWRETALWTLIAAVLVAWLARKGITTYFFAEAFVYLGSYREAGDSFLGALVRPHAHIFFRPSIWAVNLAWNLIAPPDALLYHLRNVALIVINAMLLHRLLLRLVPDRFGRGVAMAFYAISKVHLTTIGYVATFSTILLLFATLSMFLAFCRWLEQGRRADFIVTIFFATFLVFSKDYGAVAVLLLPFLAWARGAAVRAAIRPFVIPLVIVIVTYGGIRAWVAPPPARGPYEPRVDARVFARKSVQAATTLANLSLFEAEGRTGARGLTRLVWPDDSRGGRRAEAIVLLAFLAFVGALTWRARPPLALIVFCVAWGGLFFSPTMLGRNEQLYYHNDLVAAVAVLLGAAAAVAWRPVVVAILVVLALNAEVSQRSMRYSWYDLSEALRPLDGIVERYRTAPITSIVFVTDDPPLWNFALRADGLAPFVQTLAGKPELEVRVVDRREGVGEAGLVIDVDRGFRVASEER
ncbi:MAG TPA: hypothetical protein VF701_13190 [Thermoanaerobaculia bacterium]